MNSDYLNGRLGVYHLINTKTGKKIGRSVELRSREASAKNEAFGMNKVSKKYVLYVE